ncbi:hypothetical protein MAR_012970 [Mya arenaria]|uniref:Uncharacterized protein n=1 Tax=Mya arenaria TaxID=6604 RepID=A0ABY7G7M3_MYAAR|nr:hypothetical protein MAR_012970 [Mya arenaria]
MHILSTCNPYLEHWSVSGNNPVCTFEDLEADFVLQSWILAVILPQHCLNNYLFKVMEDIGIPDTYIVGDNINYLTSQLLLEDKLMEPITEAQPK